MFRRCSGRGRRGPWGSASRARGRLRRRGPASSAQRAGASSVGSPGVAERLRTHVSTSSRITPRTSARSSSSRCATSTITSPVLPLPVIPTITPCVRGWTVGNANLPRAFDRRAIAAHRAGEWESWHVSLCLRRCEGQIPRPPTREGDSGSGSSHAPTNTGGVGSPGPGVTGWGRDRRIFAKRAHAGSSGNDACRSRCARIRKRGRFRR